MLEGISYCPILHSRLAEIKALQQLSASTKDRLFPLIVARPWPNANQLERTWEKITSAVSGRRYALDLDRTRYKSNNSKEASGQFDELFNDVDGFANYYRLVSSLENAFPVLRVDDGVAAKFNDQAKHVDEIDRGLVVRIEHGPVSQAFILIDQVLNRFSDIVFFVDAGWSNNLLGREIWASSIIGHITDILPGAELVISGSSFPEQFSDIEQRGVISVKERYLHSNLIRRHNAAALVYGDWGSTRPPFDPVPMRNIPRIDLPTTQEWVSFRQNRKLEDEDYSDIARRIIADSAWPADLKIWGTYIIGCTAKQLPGAIRSPAAAAAARINIHLHQQTFFGASNPMSDGDEPFTDD